MKSEIEKNITVGGELAAMRKLSGDYFPKSVELEAKMFRREA